ncbi:glutamate 5-kinase [Alicyclobacillus sp. SO9]|uniref:glutamate 5-kinase n=1 Tax=Alicyclobacillus sp. SO9 TaxID=2665646 RepID=UPI0018E7A778|nr:glutamate 5-kinase [Alicyclobacillus sp. SO9]QQE77713.1 glutamate 5-kinase [Alicyclobacillus sp. SO9]
MTRTIVVKIGTSSITAGNGELAVEKMSNIIAQLGELQRSGRWRPVLVSSGAVTAGLNRLGWTRSRMTMPEKQAAAAVGQSLLMDMYASLFHNEGMTIGQILLTREDVEDRQRFVHIRNTMMTLMENDIIPIVNENDTVAIDEIRFGDNDTLGALVSLVCEAKYLILLTDIDGLYAGNPKLNAAAKRLTDIWDITDDVVKLAGGAGTAGGTGGMRTKIAAARIATASGTDVVVASATEPDVLQRVLQQEPIGTVFHAKENRLRKRKAWLLHGSRIEGRLSIDAGAADAICVLSGSLLMPGVREVSGEFQAGAVVEIMGENGVLAHGIVNFSSADLKALLERRRSAETLRKLQEVVHRNDMVLMEGESKS